MFQRILFAKIELWLFGLFGVLFIIGTISFGAVVLNEERGNEELGEQHYGPIGDVALALAEMPGVLRQSLKPDRTMVSFQQVADTEPSGWTWSEASGNVLDGYILLSRYDGDIKRHIVELFSLADRQVVHRWTPDSKTILSQVERNADWEHIVDYRNWNRSYFRFIHPFLTSDGSLLVKNHDSPLFKLGVCGNVEWIQQKRIFHHSTQPDHAGQFWIPSYILPSKIDGVSKKFSDDAIILVDEKGKVLFEKSVAQILIDNGFFYLLFPAKGYYFDPLHLNDIEPVLSDGPFWKTGDVFLSLRNKSLIILYRPQTDEIVWMKQGPWLSQHDVDIVDDHTIAVFSNNTYDKGKHRRIRGVGEVLFYDFETGKASSPYREASESQDILTLSEGLFAFLPSGHLMIEEENRGRIFVIDQDNTVVAKFVNRAEDGLVYRLGWSRFMSSAAGDTALATIRDADCE